MTEAIHRTALVEEGVILGQDVTIGPYTIVHSGTEIGARTTIGSHCEIGLPTALAEGNPLRLGPGATVRSHSVLYQGSVVGPKLTTGHHVTIREKAEIGEGFQLGSRGDVQGHCIIGDYVRSHADVHIGQLSKLGSYIWLFPNVLLTNDPDPPSENLLGVTIEDFVVIAANSILMPGAIVGEGAVVAAGSQVHADIPAGMVARGQPAKVVCPADILRMHSDPAQRTYPWRKRFHRGYPQEIVEEWLKAPD